MERLNSISSLKGKTALVRVDYNVPLDGTRIRDKRRIIASFKTIDFLRKKGARVVLIAHLGKGIETLKPIALFLKKKYPTTFIADEVPSDATEREIKNGKPGTVFLLENIRRYPGEESNDKVFAKSLARLGDVYVNDAFSVSHRAHASVVGVPKLLPHYAGFQLETEVSELSKVFTNTARPFLFILGGAKFETKIPLIKRFIAKADEVVIAGAILNSFYKVSGFEVGKSVVDDGYDTEINTLLKNKKLLLPVDVIVSRGEEKLTLAPYEIGKEDVVVDIGPQSVALLAEKIKKSKLVVWNGPTGWYEKGFKKATIALAKAIAGSKAKAVIGGGDTGAVIEKVAGEKKNIFISTGGGATLDFLAKGKLPGIDALK